MPTDTGLTDAEFEALYGVGASAVDMNMDLDLDGVGAVNTTEYDPNFAEFWEFLKPVMSDSVVPLPPADPFSLDSVGQDGRGSGDSTSANGPGEGVAPEGESGDAEYAIDPLQMADRMQALLSGCVPCCSRQLACA